MSFYNSAGVTALPVPTAIQPNFHQVLLHPWESGPQVILLTSRVGTLGKRDDDLSP